MASVHKHIRVPHQVADHRQVIWRDVKHVQFQILVVQALFFVEVEAQVVLEVPDSPLVEPYVLAAHVGVALRKPERPGCGSWLRHLSEQQTLFLDV